jgi:hypothetical protein
MLEKYNKHIKFARISKLHAGNPSVSLAADSSLCTREPLCALYRSQLLMATSTPPVRFADSSLGEGAMGAAQQRLPSSGRKVARRKP